jgi:hypothetical protein
MTLPERYDKLATGIISGFMLPVVIAIFIFLFTKGDPGLKSWFDKISEANIITHIITLCAFPNVAIFLIFNHYDMLRACRGVLGVTIFWAVVVFGIYFFR